MSIPLFQVDAFTSEPFCGNPAGVCLLRAPRDDRWMQNVARVLRVRLNGDRVLLGGQAVTVLRAELLE